MASRLTTSRNDHHHGLPIHRGAGRDPRPRRPHPRRPFRPRDPPRDRNLRRGPFRPALWRALAEAGLLGIGLPDTLGGAGMGLLEAACVVEMAARHAAAVPVWETVGLACPVLVDAHLGDGDGASEAGSGSLESRRATPSSPPPGTRWSAIPSTPMSRRPCPPRATCTIDGTKVCVPAGAIAAAAVVPCRSTTGEVLLALVDLRSEGVTRTNQQTTAGSPDAVLEFASATGVVVGRGAASLQRAFDQGAATLCAAALGTAAAALDITAEYTKERKQFDVPIASFQAVGHRAADTFIDVQSIRLTAWHALWRLANGEQATDEVAIAKYWSAHSGHRVSLASAHLHGGVGVDRDYPLHRHFIAAKQHELQLGGARPSLLRLGRSIAANT
ncbi:MAG: acyl-CoA dehydrogenase family protein [Microthrixaceae bacterium]